MALLGVTSTSSTINFGTNQPGGGCLAGAGICSTSSASIRGADPTHINCNISSFSTQTLANGQTSAVLAIEILKDDIQNLYAHQTTPTEYPISTLIIGDGTPKTNSSYQMSGTITIDNYTANRLWGNLVPRNDFATDVTVAAQNVSTYALEGPAGPDNQTTINNYFLLIMSVTFSTPYAP